MRLFGTIDNVINRSDVLLTPPFDLAPAAPPVDPDPDPEPSDSLGFAVLTDANGNKARIEVG